MSERVDQLSGISSVDLHRISIGSPSHWWSPKHFDQILPSWELAIFFLAVSWVIQLHPAAALVGKHDTADLRFAKWCRIEAKSIRGGRPVTTRNYFERSCWLVFVSSIHGSHSLSNPSAVRIKDRFTWFTKVSSAYSAAVGFCKLNACRIDKDVV